jgi:hypothetical protein
MTDDAAGLSSGWSGNMKQLESIITLRSGYTLNHQCVKYPLGEATAHTDEHVVSPSA